jgi:signal transduction histidine kinase/HAMP domain-containing protein
MKLFQRTLLSFALVIALQALLTGSALSSVLGSMQAEDASHELATEAANAFENFNAWKLAFWKEINELAEDRALVRAVAAARAPAFDPAVDRELARRRAGSAATSMILRDSTGAARYADMESEDAVLPGAPTFYLRKDHPYVEILSSGGSLWFQGAVRVGGLAVFLLRRIDSQLIGQLSYDPMVAVAVSVPGLGPSVGGSHAASGRSAGAALDYALSLSPPAEDDRAYIRYAPTDWRGGSYSAVVQRTGAVLAAGGERPVILAAALSLGEYSARAQRLQRSIVWVTALVVAATIVVALLLSRSIVSPIRRLSRGMRRIEGGDFRAELRGATASGEIGELLEGFNLMARKLASDKLELEAYISEIVGLKERGEGIIESIREGLAVVDAEGRIESANGSFRSLFGEAAARPGGRLQDIPGGPFDESAATAVREAIRDREGGAPRRQAGGFARRAPDGRTFELKLYPLAGPERPEAGPGGARCIVVVEDASERLAYEERSIQADKLASIGALAAGVAHEINNPLSSILANVGNAIRESSDPEAIDSLRVVERETMRIARIVRQLMDFAAPGGPARCDEPSPSCDVGAAAREIVRLVGYPLRAEGKVDFVLDLDPACPPAAMPEDELKKVLLNLVKNAMHAVGDEGRILVRARPAAGGAELSVEDDGPGIPEELLGRIFDPFFTTKSGGTGAGEPRGLGLGLSVVYGIVAKRGGTIRAEPGPEGTRGSRLVAFLPACPSEPAASAAPAAPAALSEGAAV